LAGAFDSRRKREPRPFTIRKTLPPDCIHAPLTPERSIAAKKILRVIKRRFQRSAWRWVHLRDLSLFPITQPWVCEDPDPIIRSLIDTKDAVVWQSIFGRQCPENTIAVE